LRASSEKCRARPASLFHSLLYSVDLSLVFTKEAETVFYDTCCHFNLRGNRPLVEALAPRLRAAVVARQSH
jgi:hypothetical protein